MNSLPIRIEGASACGAQAKCSCSLQSIQTTLDEQGPVKATAKECCGPEMKVVP